MRFGTATKLLWTVKVCPLRLTEPPRPYRLTHDDAVHTRYLRGRQEDRSPIRRTAGSIAITDHVDPRGKRLILVRNLDGPGFEVIEKDWLRGVDLNHRPLGYESAHKRIFNKLANTDGPAKPGKEA